VPMCMSPTNHATSMMTAAICLICIPDHHLHDSDFLSALAHGNSNTDALLPSALWDADTSLCFVSQYESNSVKRLGTNLGYVYHREIIQFMPCRWLDSLVVSSSLTRHNFVPASRLLKWLVIPCRTAQTRRRCCLLCVHCP